MIMVGIFNGLMLQEMVFIGVDFGIITKSKWWQKVNSICALKYVKAILMYENWWLYMSSGVLMRSNWGDFRWISAL